MVKKKNNPGDAVVDTTTTKSGFDLFLDKLRENGIGFTTEEGLYSRKRQVPPYIKIEWMIGGRSGGSCWDTEAPVYSSIDGEPEPEFEALDKLLELVAPNITFLQYKNICRDVIKLGDSGYSDYYGNYTKYATKTVLLRDLYDTLVEKGLLKS